jgi:CMP-N-acetylneuraminic acid synthetase
VEAEEAWDIDDELDLTITKILMEQRL